MPASKGTRLFKLASQINIGKDAILEFLQGKGFSVENKPTAVLTDEMVDVVMDKFAREAKAAEKQREKLEKYHHARNPEKGESEDSAQGDIPEIEAPTEAKAEVPDHDELSESEESDLVKPKKKPAVKKTTKKKSEEESVSEEIPQELPIAASAPVEVEEKQTPAPAETIDTSATATTEDQTQEPKKKRKKRINEVEYEAGAMPQLRGLTVVGKITVPARQEEGQRYGRPDRNAKKGDRQQQGERRDDDRRQQRQGNQQGNQQSIGERLKAKGQDSGFGVSPSKADDDVGEKGNKKNLRPAATKDAKGLDKKKKKKKSIRETITEEDVTRAIRETLSGMEDSGSGFRTKLKQKKKLEREEKEAKRIEEIERESTILRLTEFVTTADLAALMGTTAAEIIMKCMSLGLMVSINQRLDKDTITLIADDYGFQVEFLDEQAAQEITDIEDAEDTLLARPPIVTIMGHVDHGKTSLLDYIRKTNVVAGESGGITQHIGAYHVDLPDGRTIAFLDTPGHEAFTAMRARGAQVTDIVVLVVAADDNVMPQTIEAISHAQAANVPIVVALNKIDKEDANPDRVKQQLADRGVLVEDWGGKYQCAEISAKKGINVDGLMEKILLEAELLNLKANPHRIARGTVIEAHLDKGKGVLASVMVQKGTLNIGDAFVAGIYSGRVRAMYDERGNRVESAGPSVPVQVSGFDGAPQAGDLFAVLEQEAEARAIAVKRQQLKREQQFKQMRPITLDEISQDILRGGTKELRLIIKGDVSGSLEALSDSLQKLSRDEAKVSILHKGVGPISESDVMLATASSAVIVGFHVSPTSQARKSAEAEGVDIRLYTIIYDCINEIQMALEGLLSPEIKEEIMGTAEIRQVFKISKIGTVAGCYVTSGKINRNDRVRVLRDGFPVYNSTLSALKRFKDDVREVDTNYECGMSINGFNDIQVGDIIEAYKQVEVKRKLS
ncbi:MAG: translation initiation factor IF-2 [Bacteroidetes bacterium]|nr:translation initiation factor IF-2 [Bacteroidota bacterium]